MTSFSALLLDVNLSTAHNMRVIRRRGMRGRNGRVGRSRGIDGRLWCRIGAAAEPPVDVGGADRVPDREVPADVDRRQGQELRVDLADLSLRVPLLFLF